MWFDPINPAPRAENDDEAATDGRPARDSEAPQGERPEGEREGGRSRRRRGRGRGRDRTAAGDETREVRVEARATGEGMPPEGSPETPMATVASEDEAPVAVAEAKRRRVRRKTPASATTTIDETVVEPNEVEPAGAAVELDVTPARAAAVASVPEPEKATEPVVEVDIATIVDEDPNQIGAPPAKPKRGWWRR